MLILPSSAGRVRPYDVQALNESKLIERMKVCMLFGESHRIRNLAPQRGVQWLWGLTPGSAIVDAGDTAPRLWNTPMGPAARFDGFAEERYRLLQIVLKSDNVDAVTVAMWIQNSAQNQYQKYFLQTTSPTNYLAMLYGYETNRYETFWYNGALRRDLYDMPTPYDYEPHLILAAYNDGGDFWSQFDGAQSAMATGVGDYNMDDEVSIYVGNVEGVGALSWHGNILSLMIWNRMLSKDEGASLYYEPWAMLQPNVYRRYSFASAPTGGVPVKQTYYQRRRA